MEFGMIGRWMWTAAAILLAGTYPSASAPAQQANISVPFNGTSSGFNEQIGVRWGLRGNGWFFNFGGGAPVPPFGGFDPNAGASFGFAGPNGFFSLTAGQGSSRSFSSQAPSVTVMNGQTGFFSDTVQRPFVTSVIPVVGIPVAPPIGAHLPRGGSVLEERLQRLQSEGAIPATPPATAPAPPVAAARSTAEHGDVSVAEIKARQAAEAASREAAGQSEIAALLEKAAGAQADGKPSLAKLYLQMAARRTSGQQQRDIQAAIERLAPPPK
jgi:hypothetical protein